MNTSNSNTGDNSQAQALPVNGASLTQELAKLGEHLGQFKAYSSALAPSEIAGTRIVKCLYQAPKQGMKAAHDNAYCRVPVKHLTEEVVVARAAELAPYIVGWLQSIEDAQIKADHKAGVTQVFTEYLSLDKIIAHLAETSNSGRLNKEKIEAWFTEYLEDELTGKFAEKLGYSIESLDAAPEAELIKLARVVNAYKVKFASLASPKVSFKEDEQEALLAVIAAVPDAESSLLGMRFVSRIKGMKAKEEDLLMTL